MYNFTAEDHRKRLENIRFVEKNAEKYFTKRLITDYIPGHYVYRNDKFGDPEEDAELLKKLGESGVGIIQIWDELVETPHGGKKMYRPSDKNAMNKLLENAHKNGIKVLPYTSTNFFSVSDENFNRAWAYPAEVDLCGHLAHCSPASPMWREQIIKQYAGLLDEYDYDGIYIDSGYMRAHDYRNHQHYYLEEFPVAEDDVLAFEDSPEHDGSMEDMLALIYSEVKSRGKILKFHKEGLDRIQSDMKLYDYLWVGECVRDIEFIRKRTKGYEPFVVPDYNYAVPDEDERYLNTVPYMQFPVIRDNLWGIGSPDAAKIDFEYQLKWLKLYKQFTTKGTWCYTEAEIPELIPQKGKKTVASLFINNDMYLVLANYGNEEDTVKLNRTFTEYTPDGKGKTFKGEIKLPARKIKVLKCEDRFYVDGKKPEDFSDSLLADQKED